MPRTTVFVNDTLLIFKKKMRIMKKWMKSNWLFYVLFLLVGFKLEKYFMYVFVYDEYGVFKSLLYTCMHNYEMGVWLCRIKYNKKLILYKNWKKDLIFENYLCMKYDRHLISNITRLRLGVLNLRVETGRFVQRRMIERVKRICWLCCDGIEDEIHFLLMCPVYVDLREKLFNDIYDVSRGFWNFNWMMKKGDMNDILMRMIGFVNFDKYYWYEEFFKYVLIYINKCVVRRSKWLRDMGIFDK